MLLHAPAKDRDYRKHLYEAPTLCHRTGNGSFHQITISVNAVPAHLRHGDVSPDQYGDCP